MVSLGLTCATALDLLFYGIYIYGICFELVSELLRRVNAWAVFWSNSQQHNEQCPDDPRSRRKKPSDMMAKMEPTLSAYQAIQEMSS